MHGVVLNRAVEILCTVVVINIILFLVFIRMCCKTSISGVLCIVQDGNYEVRVLGIPMLPIGKAYGGN